MGNAPSSSPHAEEKPWMNFEKHGWLSHGIGGVSNWFVLNRGKLFWFHSAQVNNSSQPIGTVTCQVAESVHGDECTLKLNHTKYLKAGSSKEKAEWIHAIQNTRHPDKPWMHPELQGWLSHDKIDYVTICFCFNKTKWKRVRNWFVLKEGKLYWFETNELNNSSEPTGSLIYTDVVPGTTEFGFKFNKGWRFYAGSANEKREWIQKIKATRKIQAAPKPNVRGGATRTRRTNPPHS